MCPMFVRFFGGCLQNFLWSHILATCSTYPKQKTFPAAFSWARSQAGARRVFYILYCF